MEWLDMCEIKTPNLRNNKAGQELKEAKALLISGYLNKVELVSDYIKLANSELMLDAFNSKGEIVQKSIVLSFIYIFSAGEMLGIETDEITKLTRQ